MMGQSTVGAWVKSTSRQQYARLGGSFVPASGRQAIFVGDLIDRGPEQIKVLHAVRAVVQ